jgi:DNA-binding NarL/FixJ family response regulator
MQALRILLVDDHILFRKGVAGLLATQPYLTVVGEAGDGEEAIARARELVPDVILMDVTMPNRNGLEATRAIKREMPHVHIIMLTVSDTSHDVFAAIKNGADGYLLKNLEPAQLYDMLDGLRRGEAPISSKLAVRILQEFREPDESLSPTADPSESLTPRERQVLELVVTGASNRQIAEALALSNETVKIHLSNILAKLHLQNRIQVAVYAVRQGLVST